MYKPISVSKSETIAPNLEKPEEEFTIIIHESVVDKIGYHEIRQLRDLLNVFIKESNPEK